MVHELYRVGINCKVIVANYLKLSYNKLRLLKRSKLWFKQSVLRIFCLIKNVNLAAVYQKMAFFQFTGEVYPFLVRTDDCKSIVHLIFSLKLIIRIRILFSESFCFI